MFFLVVLGGLRFGETSKDLTGQEGEQQKEIENSTAPAPVASVKIEKTPLDSSVKIEKTPLDSSVKIEKTPPVTSGSDVVAMDEITAINLGPLTPMPPAALRSEVDFEFQFVVRLAHSSPRAPYIPKEEPPNYFWIPPKTRKKGKTNSTPLFLLHIHT